jgi:hypothetical protein
MNIKELKDADLSLVELKDPTSIGRLTPHCKLHGAMNKLTPDGIWRCMATYRYERIDKATTKFHENNCKAGCQECLQ